MKNIDRLDETQPISEPVEVVIGDGKVAIISFDKTSNAWHVSTSEGEVLATLRKGLSGTWHVVGGIQPSYSHDLRATLSQWIETNEDLF